MTRVPQKFCGYKECGRPVQAKSLCMHHYTRMNKGRNMDAPIGHEKPLPVCAADDCDWQVLIPKHKFCATHRARQYRNADPTTRAVNSRRLEWGTCKVPACNRKAEAKQGRLRHYCGVHNNQLRRGVEPGVYREQGIYDTCQITGCEKPFRVNKMCSAHNLRSKKYGLVFEELDATLQSPCQICGNQGDIHIDHDHSCCEGEFSCGECVRGPLCDKCNVGIGSLRDSPDIMRAAIKYLEAWQESKTPWYDRIDTV